MQLLSGYRVITAGRWLSQHGVGKSIVETYCKLKFILYCRFTEVHSVFLVYLEKFSINKNSKSLLEWRRQLFLFRVARNNLYDVHPFFYSTGCSSTWLKIIKSPIFSAKQYLKAYFKLDVGFASRCPDHSITFALSDRNYSCTHVHDMGCGVCDDLREMLDELNGVISSSSVRIRWANTAAG